MLILFRNFEVSNFYCYLIASRIPPDRDSYSVLKLVRHFCCSEVLGPLRMFWGSFGAASWGLLDSFWGFLGSSWSLLGGSGGPLGATWGALGEVLGPVGMVLGLMLQQVIFWKKSRWILSRFWGPKGSPKGAKMESKTTQNRSINRRWKRQLFGTVFGSFWGRFGANLVVKNH